MIQSYLTVRFRWRNGGSPSMTHPTWCERHPENRRFQVEEDQDIGRDPIPLREPMFTQPKHSKSTGGNTLA